MTVVRWMPNALDSESIVSPPRRWPLSMSRNADSREVMQIRTRCMHEFASLRGMTTAIIVDQEWLVSHPRSTVGTITDANALLRILFSRLGQPHIGSPQAFSFNTATVSGAGAITVDKGGTTTREKLELSRSLALVPMKARISVAVEREGTGV